MIIGSHVVWGVCEGFESAHAEGYVFLRACKVSKEYEMNFHFLTVKFFFCFFYMVILCVCVRSSFCPLVKREQLPDLSLI